jgi:hypothetical protein
MFNLKDYAKKAFKFMVIGAVGSVVNLGLLYFFVEYVKLWYLWGEVIAILVAFMVNFNGNILVKNIHITKDTSKAAADVPVVKEIKKEEELTASSPVNPGS